MNEVEKFYVTLNYRGGINKKIYGYVPLENEKIPTRNLLVFFEIEITTAYPKNIFGNDN